MFVHVFENEKHLFPKLHLSHLELVCTIKGGCMMVSQPRREQGIVNHYRSTYTTRRTIVARRLQEYYAFFFYTTLHVVGKIKHPGRSTDNAMSNQRITVPQPLLQMK
jgi:hypothetical protein